MIESIDLLRRAKADLAIAKRNIKLELSDEVEYDIIAYHIQQAIEKTLKFNLEMNGIKYAYTHVILELLSFFDNNNIDYPDWVYNNAETLTSYGTKTRYGKSLVANKRKMNELIPLAEKYIEDSQPHVDDSDNRFKPSIGI